MSTDCRNMIHPFQHDPGISQNQRRASDLLTGDIQIDGRNLAELLDFFVQLSRHVNFYDEKMLQTDWQPFFRKSLPFTLAGIARFDKNGLQNQVDKMKGRFKRRPSVSGLNNLFSFIYINIVKKINGWQQLLHSSELPLELVIDKRIQNKLTGPLKAFIRNTNTGTYWLCTRNFNFTPLLQNPVWQLTSNDITSLDESFPETGATRRRQLMALYEKTISLIPAFLEVIGILGHSAEQSLNQSLLPLKSELQEKHTPHLALLFAFLKLFESLKSDLNSFTRKHLDYFYHDVLKIQPKKAVPDQIHLVFEIQQLLDKYKLEKGLLLKDGKDGNKAEIYFSTDNEIVVNKTLVAEQKTLFLNLQNIKREHSANGSVSCTEFSGVEGIYMAPDATKSNGIDKGFPEAILPARTALGSRWSKYKDPEHQFIYPYPNARIGLIMASPVLLLNEGKRTITITLKCQLTENLCKQLFTQTSATNPCCSEPAPNAPNPKTTGSNCNSPLPESELAQHVAGALGETYYYVNRPLIAEAVKKGASKELKEMMKGWLEKTHTKNEPDSDICYCAQKEQLYERLFGNKEFLDQFNGNIPELVKEIFKPRKALNVQFSGEKKWIAPKNTPAIVLAADPAGTINDYLLTICITLQPDEEPVTFYNAENLKEELGTTLPAVKLELDDTIKIQVNNSTCAGRSGNCYEKPNTSKNFSVSLYHFFRGLKIMNGSKIDVEVCGLKNLIVQNDESLQDVNAPIFAFGTRPKVGASFYIGSKEIFLKNWTKLYVNAEWKDRPLNFEKHYEHYAYPGYLFEDGSTKIQEGSFKIKGYVLHNGNWVENGTRRLFKRRAGEPPLPSGEKPETVAPFCNHPNPLEFNQDVYDYDKQLEFPAIGYSRSQNLYDPFLPLSVASRNGFMKLTLLGVNFQHDAYPFVLARQMMAYGDLISPTVIGPVIQRTEEAQALIQILKTRLNTLTTNITSLTTEWIDLDDNLNNLLTGLNTRVNTLKGHIETVNGAINPPPANNLAVARPAIISAVTLINNVINNVLSDINSNFSVIDPIVGSRNVNGIEHELIKDNLAFPQILVVSRDPIVFLNINQFGINRIVREIEAKVNFIFDNLKVEKDLKDGLPSEPYTPVIKSLSLDYTATADVLDIDLVHLYPYTGTYKTEITAQQPALLPTYCDEGNLYVGLKDLVPGSNVHILFQLAEATANSETERETVSWYYLENNEWKQLRTGFEILNDDTNGLTTSGIIQFAMPANMTNENTILTKNLHWLRASIPCKSRSVSEILALHTQAVKATFTNEEANDKLRLSKPLAAGSVAKLKVADSSVKKITQNYESFGGRVPEAEGHFYTRVSELLRHKNRAIQKTDYELMALEAFPQLFKVKCINHSYWLDAGKYDNDFPMAPGFVLIAVIPDLEKLKAAENFEPRVPVSLLENIETYLKRHISPFVRAKAMNPRYEKVNFCISAKLLEGKDEVYYKARLAQDIREFLAPWAVGEYEKLSFGQSINRSDIIRFLETRDYLDYITGLTMQHETDNKTPIAEVNQESEVEIIPISPRSILIAGNIDVCINQMECEEWCQCIEKNKPCCRNKMEKFNHYCGSDSNVSPK